MRLVFHRCRAALVTGYVLAAASTGLVLAPSAVQAQFICVGNTNGAAVPPGAASGAGATAGFNLGVACGPSANASGDGSANNAFGGSANASGINGSVNTAIGDSSNASGDGSQNTATGSGANASGNGSGNVAMGEFANASGAGVSNVAIGNHANATGANSTAMGNGASATFSNSAAFGNGATVTRANQQVFGTASNTYTMTGITSAASKAAQSGTLQLVTSDAAGNLATAPLAAAGVASTGDIAGINAQLNDLTSRSNKAYTGVAMAFAMAGVPTVLPHEKIAMTMNYGNFQGTNGLALNAAVRLGEYVQLNGGIGYGINENIAGGRIGVRVGW